MTDKKQTKERLIIIGAAGRDFHDFNVYWKNRSDIEVVCFTAAQIPDIAGRKYPAELAGEKYPDGIPIHDQEELPNLIKKFNVQYCVLAYSDLSYQTVMELASLVNASGAAFITLPPKVTMLKSTKPVISVCAVRTGCGKSQTTRWVADVVRGMGNRVACVRHPMPYGDLVEQRCQKYTKLEDMQKYKCTIEEMEEYEQHIEAGNLLFAGVDYEMILREAEKEADVIIWDGGNNDLPFYKPDLAIVITDPLRSGDEVSYYPGETNVRMADVILINKVNSATPANVNKIKDNLKRIVPEVPVLLCDSTLSADIKGRPADEEARSLIKGKRVLAVDDGPTLTHGGMQYGAGYVLANDLGAGSLVHPAPFLQGSLQGVFKKYPHLLSDLPAMGYGEKQIADLKATIAKACEEAVDVVVVGTPIDLSKLIPIPKPSVRVRYRLTPKEPGVLKDMIAKALGLNGKEHAAREHTGETATDKPAKSAVSEKPARGASSSDKAAISEADTQAGKPADIQVKEKTKKPRSKGKAK